MLIGWECLLLCLFPIYRAEFEHQSFFGAQLEDCEEQFAAYDEKCMGLELRIAILNSSWIQTDKEVPLRLFILSGKRCFKKVKLKRFTMQTVEL